MRRALVDVLPVLRSSSMREASRLPVAGVLILLLLVTACAGAPSPCVSPSDCAEGTECLANFCSAVGDLPVSQGHERVELPPASMSVVSASRHRASLPAAVVLGSRSVGAVSLYLRFALPTVSKARLERAFLRLDPASGVAPSTDRVPVQVWRVATSWTPSTLRWLSQPPTRPPGADGLARTNPPQSLRIDVTELARYLRENPQDDHGIVLKAAGVTSRGAVFSTGAASGKMPVLELYLRPE
jgi:hypothetical protein